MKDEQKAKAKEVFAAYKKENMVYITSDNQAFLQGHFASAHARTLTDSEVVSISREQAEKEDAPAPVVEVPAPAEEVPAPAEEVPAPEGKAKVK